MKKISISIFFFIVTMVFPIFAQNQETKELRNIPFEDIKYFEKIRWTEYYPAASISSLSMNFSFPPAEKYYKLKLYYRDQYRVLFRLLGGEENSFFEFNKPQVKFKDYWVPVLALGYLNKDKERIETGAKDLDGLYITQNEMIEKFYIKEIPSSDYFIGYVQLSYNEDGMHFIRYSPEEVAFYSDNFYGEKCDESKLLMFNLDRNNFMNTTFGVTAYNSDDFKLTIKSYGNCNEKMVLKTNQYELNCIPQELLIKPGTACSTYGKKIILYSKPIKDDQEKKEFDEIPFEVLERQTKWEEIDCEMSMWYRIRLKTGEEGWVWGRNISINSKVYSDWGTYRE